MDIHPEISAYIQKHDQAVQAILLKLREAVMQAGDFSEAIKWGNPTFENDRKICDISWYKDHAKLGFFDCRKVKDPGNLLEGTGAKMRHIKIYYEAEIDSECLTGLVKQAALEK